jgi:hypothetical protein
MGGIPFARESCSLRIISRMQQGLPVDRAVIGNEKEDQPIDDTKKLAMEISELQLAGAQGLAQGRIPGVASESLAEDLLRPLYTAAQVA